MSLPVHRSILAVDIEGSTQRTNPVKEELRYEVYRLDLDVAFRLLEAPRFKKEFKNATVPLALVTSDYIYRSVVKQGYEGIDDRKYFQLVTVNVGGQHWKGWVHLPPGGGVSAVPPLPQAS